MWEQGGSEICDFTKNVEKIAYPLAGELIKDIIKHYEDLDVNFVVPDKGILYVPKDDEYIRLLAKLDGVEYKVLDFGKAPYKFDEVGKPSYYIIVQNHQGLNKDYWGKALEIMIKSNNIKVGDTVIRNQADLKEFVKVETATQEVTQPLEQEKRSGFKI